MIFLELAGFGIKPSEQVRDLARVPNRAVRCNQRIMRSRVGCREGPLFDGSLYASSNHGRGRLGLLGVVLGEIVDDNWNLILGERSAVIQHNFDDELPTVAVQSG